MLRVSDWNNFGTISACTELATAKPNMQGTEWAPVSARCIWGRLEGITRYVRLSVFEGGGGNKLLYFACKHFGHVQILAVRYCSPGCNAAARITSTVAVPMNKVSERAITEAAVAGEYWLDRSPCLTVTASRVKSCFHILEGRGRCAHQWAWQWLWNKYQR